MIEADESRERDFSVVVCTRDRGRSLEPTLAALAAHRAAVDWEVIVVDNGSRDGTPAIARGFAAADPARFRMVEEPVVGLSAARNRGLREARGEVVVYLDDDAQPVDGWLEAYAGAFVDPSVASAGGPVEPVYSGPLPGWLEPRHLPYLSVWDRGSEPIELRYNELPRGANVAYRRSALGRAGEFDRRLGRIGRSLRSCEEIELGLRLERLGLRSLYVPAARVRHRVDAGRLTPSWIEARFAAQGFSEAIIDWKHYGWVGLRAGFARAKQAVSWTASADGATSLQARFVGAARRAYRRGAFYAVVSVPRWTAADRAAPVSQEI